MTYPQGAVRLYVSTYSVVAWLLPRLHPRARRNVHNMRWCYVRSNGGPLATSAPRVDGPCVFTSVLRVSSGPRFARNLWRQLHMQAAARMTRVVGAVPGAGATPHTTGR